MSYAYAYVNKLAGLAASAFTWATGPADSTRSRLNDTKMGARYVVGAAVATLENVIIDMGVATQLTGFALLNSNYAAQQPVKVTILGADDAGMSVNVVTAKASTTLNRTAPYDKDHVFQFVAVTKRYWQIYFTWTGGGTVTNFALGEIFAFNAQTALSRKSDYGGGEAPEFKTANVDFYGGGGNAYLLGGEIRQKNLPYSDLSLAERNEQMTLWRAVKGPVTPFLWIESYEATATAAADAEQEVIFGQLLVNTFAWQENDYQRYTPPPLVVRSLGREIGA